MTVCMSFYCEKAIYSPHTTLASLPTNTENKYSLLTDRRKCWKDTGCFEYQEFSSTILCKVTTKKWQKRIMGNEMAHFKDRGHLKHGFHVKKSVYLSLKLKVANFISQTFLFTTAFPMLPDYAPK